MSVAAGSGGGAQPDIFGLQLQDVFRNNAAAGEVDVLCGTQTDAAASDLTVVIDVFRTQIHHTAAGYRAVVQHTLQTGEADLLGADQRAGGIHVALSGHHIDFGHQQGLCAAVGQADTLLFQPNDVAGQAGHLFGRQGNTGHQVLRAGEGDAGIHQGFELLLVVLVAVQPLIAGQFGDLLVDQALLVIAVAEAFVGIVGILPEAAQHIVAAQPAAIVGEGRIGFNQPAGPARIDFEQAAVG